jgi:hypothetical protein
MRLTVVGRATAGVLGLGLMLGAVVTSPAAPWAEGSRGRPLDRALHAHAEAEAAGPAVIADLDPVVPELAVEPSSTTTTTTPPSTTTTAPPPKFTLEPYRGLGAWMDVYDWSATFAKGGPALEPDAVDVLAAQGVQTLFIQASKWDAPTDVLEPERLMAFVERAHQHDIAVVGWYLPTLEDPARDLQRMLAIAALPIEGIAVDIEARNVGDVAERNRRLIDLSAQLRAALPGMTIGAIPLEPVLLEEINPAYWPGFPWRELGPHYDVWLPMSYWTNRRGGWRDAYIYSANNINRVRHNIGEPGAPVHVIGGIGDLTTVEDLVKFRQAAFERKVLGASIYDFRTTQGPHWAELLPLRELGR